MPKSPNLLYNYRNSIGNNNNKQNDDFLKQKQTGFKNPDPIEFLWTLGLLRNVTNTTEPKKLNGFLQTLDENSEAQNKELSRQQTQDKAMAAMNHAEFNRKNPNKTNWKLSGILNGVQVLANFTENQTHRAKIIPPKIQGNHTTNLNQELNLLFKIVFSWV